MMDLNMTDKQFRRLLDLVYIGNWVLNSTRGDDRIKETPELLFRHVQFHHTTDVYQRQVRPPALRGQDPGGHLRRAHRVCYRRCG